MQQNQTEIWKPVVGYEGLYEVSNMGRVKKLFDEGFMILKCNLSNKYPYNICGISKKDAKIKTVYTHRLVAEAFIENPENKPQINHKDYNTKNNNVNNLEWVSAKENMNHRSLIPKKKSKITPFPVAESIRALYAQGELSQLAISELYGVSRRIVNRIVNNKGRTKDSRNRSSKITEQQLEEMKTLRFHGIRFTDIAKTYKISASHCMRIISNNGTKSRVYCDGK